MLGRDDDVLQWRVHCVYIPNVEVFAEVENLNVSLSYEEGLQHGVMREVELFDAGGEDAV